MPHGTVEPTGKHSFSLFVSDKDAELDEDYDYREMVARDQRRWTKADMDQDGYLTKEEFSHFLHPEDADHMRDIVVDVRSSNIDD